jgi:hypothetical protein
VIEAREDSAYWDDKYAEDDCPEHGSDWLVYDETEGRNICQECEE